MDTKKKNLILIISAAAVSACFFIFTGPIPQQASYHIFADGRTLIGIKNGLNVLSNIGFIIAGIAGIVRLSYPDNPDAVRSYRMLYFLFFSGVFLIGIGSSYYHNNPDNFTLLWDRLPMTVAFMSLFCAVVAEYISRKAGYFLLPPLLAAGIASVILWYLTEIKGIGDLRFYIIIQYLPLLLIPVIAVIYSPPFTRDKTLFAVIGIYLFAKVFEIFDREVYDFTGWISGHSIKHIIAAISIYFVIRMLRKRELTAKRTDALFSHRGTENTEKE